MLQKNVLRKQKSQEQESKALTKQEKIKGDQPLKKLNIFIKKNKLNNNSQSPLKNIQQINRNSSSINLAQFSLQNRKKLVKDYENLKLNVTNKGSKLNELIQVSFSSNKSKKDKIKLFIEKKYVNKLNSQVEQNYLTQLKNLSKLEHNLTRYYQNIQKQNEYLKDYDINVILQNFKKSQKNIKKINYDGLYEIDTSLQKSFNINPISAKNCIFNTKYSFQPFKIQTTKNKVLNSKKSLQKVFQIDQQKNFNSQIANENFKEHSYNKNQQYYKNQDQKICKKLDQLLHKNKSNNYQTFEEIGVNTKSSKYIKNKFFPLIKKFVQKKIQIDHESQFDNTELYTYLEKNSGMYLNRDSQTQKLVKVYSDYFKKQIVYDQIRKLLASQDIQVEDFFQDAFQTVYQEYIKKFSYKKRESISSLEDSSNFTITDKSSAISSVKSKFLKSLKNKQISTLQQLN